MILLEALKLDVHVMSVNVNKKWCVNSYFFHEFFQNMKTLFLTKFISEYHMRQYYIGVEAPNMAYVNGRNLQKLDYANGRELQKQAYYNGRTKQKMDYASGRVYKN